MFSNLRNNLGTAGLAVAIVALVAAVSGTALAASGALTGKQKKEVTKIAKQYAGQPGAPGAKGDTGAAGKNGANGVDGKDGAPGKEGPEGKSGFTKTLPSGETETGTWAAGVASAPAFQVVPISFAIPLAKGESPAIKFLAAGGGGTPECPGTAENPEAAPGKLCVYTLQSESLTYNAVPFPIAHVSGAALFFEEATEGVGFGTWAVTAK